MFNQEHCCQDGNQGSITIDTVHTL